MKTVTNRKQTVFIIFFLLAVVLMFPASALASVDIVEGTVGKTEVLDQSLILYASEVVMDGVINGDLLAIGNDVSINGEVDGSLFAVGKNVSINGPIAGTIYVAALKLQLDSKASVGRDVYYIGTFLESNENATVARDLHVVSLEANLSGTVGGDVDAMIGTVNIITYIYNFMLDKGWLSQPLQFKLPWSSGGYDIQSLPLTAFGLSLINNDSLASESAPFISSLNSDHGQQIAGQGSTIDVERLKSWAVPLLRNLAALIILGLLVLWLVPAQLIWAGEQVRSNFWRMLLTGLLVFIIGWFAALLVLVVILGLAIFLYWVSLPGLGFLTGSLGLMALGFTLIVFWLSIAYFSKIIVAFLFGTWLFQRFLPKFAHKRILPFLTGVVIYALLASIPYLGWLVVVFATFTGLGALWRVANIRRLSVTSPADTALPAEETPDTSVVAEE
jgi:hypothetical protein